MRSTSPRWDAGMWFICWPAIRLLRLGTNGLGGGCLGGEVTRGGGLTTRTSLVNLASHRAASAGEGESSVGESALVKGAKGMPSTGDAGGVSRSVVLCGAVEEGSRDESCPSGAQPSVGCSTTGRATTSRASSSNIGSTKPNLTGGCVPTHIASANGSGSRERCWVVDAVASLVMSAGATVVVVDAGLAPRRRLPLASSPTPTVTPSLDGGPTDGRARQVGGCRRVSEEGDPDHSSWRGGRNDGSADSGRVTCKSQLGAWWRGS
jgi:hypothetical protein